MRKVLASFILAILAISLLSNPAYANGENDADAAKDADAVNDADAANGEYNAFDKLTRGTINLLVSPLELIQAIGDAYGEHDMAVALPMGFFWGPVNTVKRAAVGIFEIATFLLPMPNGYGPIIEEPVFMERKAEKLKKAEEAKAEELKAKKGETKEIEGEEEPPKPERHPLDYLPDMPDDML